MIEVFKFWVRYWYEENKEWQDPKLGNAQGTPRKYSRKIQATKLGDAPEGTPLSSPTLSITSLGAMFSFITWYVFYFEHQFYFVRIFLLLFIIMFCIFYFNKSGNDSLYYAHFASLHVAIWKQKVYRCCKNSLEKSECDKMLKLFGK